MDFNKALFGFIRVAFSIMIALLVLFAGIKSAASAMILATEFLLSLP
ncbi:MAG: hypothetical protein ACLRI8_04975 [Agathobacter rectalis]